jgi:large repetitive protein
MRRLRLPSLGPARSWRLPGLAAALAIATAMTPAMAGSASAQSATTAPLTVSTTALPSGSAGSSYRQTLEASGGTGHYTWSVSLGYLPLGLTLSTGGTISGAPTTRGDFPFTVQVQDGAGATATHALSVGITAGPGDPSITATTLPSGVVGTTYSHDFSVFGTLPPFSFTVVAGALPPGLSMPGATFGFFTVPIQGTPTTPGTYAFVVRMTDIIDRTYDQGFSITVTGPLPVTVSGSQTFGSTFPTFTAAPTTGSLPDGVSLIGTPSCTSVGAGTPINATLAPGPYTVDASSCSGLSLSGPNSAEYTIATVGGTFTVNQAPLPVTVSGSQTFGSASPTFVAAPATGPLPSGVTLQGTPSCQMVDTLTPIGPSLPSGLYTVDGASCTGVTLSGATAGDYTPALAGGAFTVVEAPRITSVKHATFSVTTPGTFPVTVAPGAYPAPTYALSGAGKPTWLTVGETSGLIAGTPPAGSEGVYTFTVTATNGVAPEAIQRFSLTVGDTPRITSAASTTFTAGKAGTFQVTVTPTTAPTTTFKKSGALPRGVTLTSAGILSGTPGERTGGPHAITITATNGANRTTQSFVLDVDEAPRIINSGTRVHLQVGRPVDYRVNVTAHTFPAPTFSERGSLPRGVTLTATGTLVGTPSPRAKKFNVIAISAANGVAPRATKTFYLVVLP